jgi:hypothetical protein
MAQRAGQRAPRLQVCICVPPRVPLCVSAYHYVLSLYTKACCCGSDNNNIYIYRPMSIRSTGIYVSSTTVSSYHYVSAYHYVCPHTTSCVSSYDYICVLQERMPLYLCPHTTIYVSSYHYIHVLQERHITGAGQLCVCIPLFADICVFAYHYIVSS